MQLLIGLVLAVIVAYAAYRVHSLSGNGAMAAAFVGTVVFGLGGWQWAVLLLAFFISSSILTRSFKNRKRGLNEKFSKGSERDAAQVFGNGGVATAFVLLHAIFPASSWTWIGFAAALASVNADTWATELGVLNPTLPRAITDLRKRVEKGTSGGVSLFGTGAALLGSAVIAVLAAWLSPLPSFFFPVFILVTMTGLFGSLFDSLVGATVQAMYYCPTDKKETEKHPLHTCGTETVRIRGWKWLDNDWVNFACGAFGALAALLLSFTFL
ncbi:MAG: DUF92 domain-containing protein [Chloroflexi bacterium]|nr:DUF92 domain-containing protein [Chloroflexota bacterium]